MSVPIKATRGWSASAKVAVGAGRLVDVAAAIYLLTREPGEEPRAFGMKREIVSRLHDLKGSNRCAYARVVSQVARRCRDTEPVDPGELARTAQQITRLWKRIGMMRTATLKISGRRRHLSAA